MYKPGEFEAALENLADDSDGRVLVGRVTVHVRGARNRIEGQDKLQATQHFDKLWKACKTCHADYRN